MPESINSKLKEQYDHDDSGGSLDTNLGDFLDSESASGTSNNTKWRNWAEGTGTSLNTRLFNKHGGSGSFMTRWKNWVAFSSTHSINFDGSNDYLDCGKGVGNALGDSCASFSYSVWFKANDTNVDDGIISFTDDFSGGATTGVTLRISINRLVVTFKLDGTYEFLVTGFTSTDWNHAVVVYDGSNNANTKLYINGSVVGTAGASGFPSSQNFANTNLYIGTYYSASNTFNGLIDEVGVWNTVLSASDVTSIYNNGKVIDLSNSTAYAVDRTANLKLWLRCGDKAEPESTTSIARSDFYTDFDGTDDYVSVADNDDLSFGDGSSDSPFSISAWINMDDATGFTIASKGVYNSTGEWLFNTSSADKLYFAIMDESVTNAIEECLSSSAITSDEGSWIHVVATYDGRGGSTARNGIKLYKNGSELSISASGGAGTYVSMENLGADVYSGRYSSSYSNGKISNLSIHQTVLDAQTIKQFAKSRFTPMRDNRFSVVDFDGSDDYITSSVSNFRNTDSSGGITAWVKLDSTGWMTIFSSRQASSTNYYVTLGIAGGTNGIFVASKNNDSASDVRGATDISGGGWHHVAVISDGSEYKLYVDGVLETLGTNTNNDGDWFADTTNTDVIRIGDNTGGTGYFNGDIASVAVYSSLSADEVYAQYAKGITADHSSDTNLVGYWRMGDDTSKAYPTIADSSSNSNDGTITNGASDDIVQQMVAGWDMGAFESTEELGEEGVTSISNQGGNPYETFSGASGNSVESMINSSGSGQAFTNEVGANTTSIYKIVISLTVNSGSVPTLSANQNDGTYTSGDFKTGTTHPAIVNGTNTYYTTFSATDKDFLFLVSGTNNLSNVTISVKEVLQSADLSDTYPVSTSSSPVIIDVNNPVLGAELVDNLNGTTAGWDAMSGIDLGTSGDYVTATYESGDNVTGIRFFLGSSGTGSALSSNVEVGALYKISMTGYITGTTTAYIASSDTGTRAESSSWGQGAENVSTKTFYYKPTNASGNIIYPFYEIGSYTSAGVGYVKDVSVKKVSGNVGIMTNQATSDLVYSSVLPDQSFLTGVNSAYNFIDLDGSNEYIDCGNGTSLQITKGFTISCWAKLDSSASDGTLYIMAGKDASYKGWNLQRGTANKIVFYAETGTPSNLSDIATSSSTITDSNWHHYVGVFHADGSTQCKIYIDGSDVTSSSGSAFSTMTDSGGNMHLGKSPRQTSYGWYGSISGTALWSKALSATEVSAIYTLGRHANLLDKYSDNLKGYWAMSSLDASTGLSDVGNGTIYDRSGQSNHGTATNTESADLKSSPNAEPNGYAKGDTNRSTTTP